RRLISAKGAEGASDFAAYLDAIAAAGPLDGANCPLRLGLYAADLGAAPSQSSAWPAVLAAVADPYLGGPETRCALTADARATFERLAALTYAPATEESRARGAG
ncbi:MAG: hypothetical protein AAF360_19540, partial [Pseudomonadota bacterium]